MKNKLVSILIPVYNREKLIEETVQSALNQTYMNIEIIIVDNKSTDKTWEVLQKLASQDDRIKIFQNETNIGPVRNWKRCIDEASGEYGKVLWSDDLIAPEFLDKTVSYLENEDVGFVFTGTEIFVDGTNKRTSLFFLEKSGLYDSEIYLQEVLFKGKWRFPASPGCAIFRLKDLKENLLVNIPNKVQSDFSMHAIGNDLLIYLFTANKYKLFAHVNEKLSFFREHKNSISTNANAAKLFLHYNLAAAYFYENKRIDLIKKMNTIIWLNIIFRYKEESKDFKLNKIENYYMKNTKYDLDYFVLFKILIEKILLKIGIKK